MARKPIRRTKRMRKTSIESKPKYNNRHIHSFPHLVLTMLLIVIAILVIASPFFMENKEPHTEVYFINYDEFPQFAEMGDEVDLIFRIKNLEQLEKSYKVVVAIEYYQNERRLMHTLDEFNVDIAHNGQKTLESTVTMTEEFDKALISITLEDQQQIFAWVHGGFQRYFYDEIGYRDIGCIEKYTAIPEAQEYHIDFSFVKESLGRDHQIELFIDGSKIGGFTLEDSAVLPLSRGFHILDFVFLYNASVPLDNYKSFQINDILVNGVSIPADNVVIDRGYGPHSLDCKDTLSGYPKLYDAGAYRTKIMVR